MVDPGFLRMVTTLEGMRKPVIFQKNKQTENCMKMKEFGPQGERGGGAEIPWIHHSFETC